MTITLTNKEQSEYPSAGEGAFVSLPNGKSILVTVVEPQPDYDCVVVIDGKEKFYVVPIARISRQTYTQKPLF